MALTPQEQQELEVLRKDWSLWKRIPRLIELERKDALDEACRVKIYAAIIGECENLEVEHRGTYLGNGHHLAQRLLELIKDAISPPARHDNDGPPARP